MERWFLLAVLQTGRMWGAGRASSQTHWVGAGLNLHRCSEVGTVACRREYVEKPT
ncbi:uncharacterized protein H6S33_004173 [Morchella sextelata]|uniref:uncharacterized protein n=1 Tax=Morchella sextelata TaxID=1174677 RepID=UPI001D04D0A2|nr:uncharacterized protein H6S33_004173 [Morchella sextelata]KAH0605716.1 hypothetical protein H6S33_004173 [Morchella sextelata]